MRKPNSLIVSKPIEGFFFLFVIAISAALLPTPYYLFAILPGLFILFLFILGRKPQLGYYLIIFLIPFGAYRELTSSYQFLTLSKLVGFWIVIVVLFHALFKKVHSFDIKSNLWPWLLIFLIVGVFSALMSQYPSTSFDSLRKLLAAVIIFALTLFFVSFKDFKLRLPIIIISSTAVTSFLSVVGYLFNIPYFAMDIESLKRASGLLGSPNHFAFLILFSLPLLFHYFFSSRKPFVKISAFVMVLMNIIAIILSYSRGAAIVLAVILFILFIENMRRLKPRHLGFIGLFFVIVIMATLNLVPHSYWERQKSTFADTAADEAIKRRTSYLYVAMDTFGENPILGSGPGAFKDVYAASSYAREYIREGVAPERYAHNTYLEVLIGTGISGFVVFFVILLNALRNFHKAKRNFMNRGREELASLVAAYRLSFVSVLIYFFMLSSFYHKYFWLSLGLSQIAVRLSQGAQEEDS